MSLDELLARTSLSEADVRFRELERAAKGRGTDRGAYYHSLRRKGEDPEVDKHELHPEFERWRLTHAEHGFGPNKNSSKAHQALEKGRQGVIEAAARSLRYQGHSIPENSEQWTDDHKQQVHNHIARQFTRPDHEGPHTHITSMSRLLGGKQEYGGSRLFKHKHEADAFVHGLDSHYPESGWTRGERDEKKQTHKHSVTYGIHNVNDEHARRIYEREGQPIPWRLRRRPPSPDLRRTWTREHGFQQEQPVIGPVSESLFESDARQREFERQAAGGDIGSQGRYLRSIYRTGDRDRFYREAHGTPHHDAHFADLARRVVDTHKTWMDDLDKYKQARVQTRESTRNLMQRAADHHRSLDDFNDAVKASNAANNTSHDPSRLFHQGDMSTEDHVKGLAVLHGLHSPEVKRTKKGVKVKASMRQGNYAQRFGFPGIDEFKRSLRAHHGVNAIHRTRGYTRTVHATIPHKEEASTAQQEDVMQEIMFWSEDHRPDDYVGCVENVDVGTLDKVLNALKGGAVHESYKGWAECRICGAHLGSRDLVHEGFIFPDQAEHYIEEHGVWTPALDRFAEALSWLPEEAEVDKDKSVSCGVFIPLPYDLAKDFPDKKLHDDSVPHFTVLYVGACSPEAYQTLCKIVRQVARKLKPFSMDLAHYGEFMNKEGQKIAHMRPGILSQFRLAALHGLLRRAIEEFGKEINVQHTYGPGESKKIPYEAQFKPHATLAYLPPMMPYRGAKPTGSWRVTELEVWGHETIRVPLGSTKAMQPIGLDRDPLIAIDYPMAVPDVIRGEKEDEHKKPDMVKIKLSGSRIRIEGYEDKITGGKADKNKPEDFDPEQLAMGIKVEREHTKDPDLAREIAMDHLKENPRYYTYLKKMEKQFESETSLKGYETHSGLGGSHGDIGLDGSLPYFEQMKAIEKQLRRKKLAGL